MSKKSILAVFLITVLSICGLAYFTSTSAKTSSKYVNPLFKEYISAYTSGMVSVESKVIIVLQEETVSEIEIGKQVDNNLFTFSPAIDGKITWLDNKTIEFCPTEKLKPNQNYQATFNLGSVMNVSDDLKKFEFDFTTIKQALEISIEEYKVDENNQLQVLGTLNTADFADNTLLEKTILAMQGDKSLPIVWLHENASTHHFTINNVKKGLGIVTLSLNGEALNADIETKELQLEIPGANDFSLMNTIINNEPDQYISLQFSDKLDPNQNLDGLITIDNTGTTAVVEESEYYGNNAESLPAKESKLTFLIEGNVIKVYTPERYIDEKSLVISSGIKNSNGKTLKEAITKVVFFEDLKPNVRLVGKGVILPNSSSLLFPFEAVNLNAVDVKITRIYENNMLQFLQINNLEGNEQLRRVGKLIVKKKIPLQVNGNPARNKWNKYSIDLSSLIKTEPGALYNVKISFNKNYSIYSCSGDTTTAGDEPIVSENDDEEKDWDYYGYYDDYGDDYYYYDYSERNNPCSRAYYNNKSITRNILATNIGLVAKRGNNGDISIFTSDILTTKPLSNVTIEAYDFQQQKLKEATTNAEGMCVINTKQKPFVIIAKFGSERTYLKLEDGTSLSLSAFEVDGEEIQKGVKGFIYGERGV